MIQGCDRAIQYMIAGLFWRPLKDSWLFALWGWEWPSFYFLRQNLAQITGNKVSQ